MRLSTLGKRKGDDVQKKEVLWALQLVDLSRSVQVEVEWSNIKLMDSAKKENHEESKRSYVYLSEQTRNQYRQGCRTKLSV